MIGKKIRMYREFRGFNQLQLAEMSGINVGTIRKYELGIRNPKPDQLEKIASALGLNVSVFLDLNVETVGDVLSLLFTIDNAVDLDLTESENGICFQFRSHTLQDILQKWCEFKRSYNESMKKIDAIDDPAQQEQAIDALNQYRDEWMLRAMGTTLGCNRIIRKGMPESNEIRVGVPSFFGNENSFF